MSKKYPPPDGYDEEPLSQLLVPVAYREALELRAWLQQNCTSEPLADLLYRLEHHMRESGWIK